MARCYAPPVVLVHSGPVLVWMFAFGAYLYSVMRWGEWTQSVWPERASPGGPTAPDAEALKSLEIDASK